MGERKLLFDLNGSSMTEEDFARFALSQDSLKLERSSTGRITVLTPSFPETSRLIAKILTRLDTWSEKNGSGDVYDSSVGWTLPNKAVRSPDVSWLSKKLWNKAMEDAANKTRFPHVVPEFVIEVRSGSDSLKKQMTKMREWVQNGCELGWLVDPKGNKTYVFSVSVADPKVVDFTESLSGEPILPGFKINISSFA